MPLTQRVMRAWAMLVQLSPLVLVFPLASCSRRQNDQPKGRPPPLVTVAKVEQRDVADEVHAPVDLRPVRQTDVVSKLVGYLDAVLVDVGDSVKRGQVIALVNPSDLQGQLTAVESNVSQARASLALARANFERAEQLLPKGIVSQQEYEQARAAFEAAKSQVDATQGTARALGSRVGESRIVAPLDGFVWKRRLDPGALVGTPSGNAPILSIVDTKTLRMIVPVRETHVAETRTGLAAHAEFDALPGRSFRGAVVRVAPALDTATRTLDAEVHLANDDGALRPGMYGRASIVLSVHTQALVVPATALQLRDQKPYVFVHGGGKVSRRSIEIGIDGGDWIEVRHGLQAADEIVTAGADGLADGSAVRVAPAASVKPVGDQPMPAGDQTKPPGVQSKPAGDQAR